MHYATGEVNTEIQWNCLPPVLISLPRGCCVLCVCLSSASDCELCEEGESVLLIDMVPGTWEVFGKGIMLKKIFSPDAFKNGRFYSVLLQQRGETSV